MKSRREYPKWAFSFHNFTRPLTAPFLSKTLKLFKILFLLALKHYHTISLTSTTYLDWYTCLCIFEHWSILSS